MVLVPKKSGEAKGEIPMEGDQYLQAGEVTHQVRLDRIQIERDLDRTLERTWQARRRARQVRLTVEENRRQAAEARRLAAAARDQAARSIRRCREAATRFREANSSTAC